MGQLKIKELCMTVYEMKLNEIAIYTAVQSVF